MPLFYSYVGLTDKEFARKKREKQRMIAERKNTNKSKHLSLFEDQANKRKLSPLEIEEEDERLSK